MYLWVFFVFGFYIEKINNESESIPNTIWNINPQHSYHIKIYKIIQHGDYLRAVPVTFPVLSFCVFHQVNVGVIAPPYDTIRTLETSQHKQLQQKGIQSFCHLNTEFMQISAGTV